MQRLPAESKTFLVPNGVFLSLFRGPAGVLIGRRERGRTELQAAERSKKRAATEKALRDDDARLALIEAQKVNNMAWVFRC